MCVCTNDTVLFDQNGNIYVYCFAPYFLIRLNCLRYSVTQTQNSFTLPSGSPAPTGVRVICCGGAGMRADLFSRGPTDKHLGCFYFLPLPDHAVEKEHPRTCVFTRFSE